jgi:HSP20 family protein
MFDFPSMGWRHPSIEMERMARRMDLLANGIFGGNRLTRRIRKAFPVVTVFEDHNHYHVQAAVPGVSVEDIKLEVIGAYLSIAGERRTAGEDDDARFHRRERHAGRFSRVIRLPEEVHPDKVNAKLADGVLTVTIAKPETAKPKKISVKSS